MGDAMSLQQKLLKLKIGNAFGIKQLNTRNSNYLNGKYFFREALSNRLREYSKQQVENARHSYQKKKLKVVKGKTSTYRERLRQNQTVFD